MKKIFLLVVSLLFSFFLAELFLRVFFPQQLIRVYEGIWEPNPQTGWHHQKNSDVDVNTGDRRVRFATDENGFRMEPNIQNRFPRNKEGEKIVLIGDSFLEALQVDYLQSLPALVQKRLDKEFGPGFSVIGDGVSGWSPVHYLAESKRLLSDPNFQANLAVVFLFVGNDITGSIDEAVLTPSHPHPDRKISLPGSFRYDAFVMSVLYPIDSYLESVSYFYVFLKNRSEVLRARLGLTRHSVPAIFFKSEKDSDVWNETAKAGRQISDIWKERGTRVVFVLIPTVYQVDEDMFEHYAKMFKLWKNQIDLMQPNSMLAKTFRQEGLTLIDPTKKMKAESQRGKKLYGRVDRHLSAAGHQVISDYIWPVFRSDVNQ